MFDAAENLSQREIKAYRNFAFPEQLGDSGHDPFFSVENAPNWVTSFGYQLYLDHDDAVTPSSLWTPEDASTKQLRAYREYLLSEEYLGHPFFNLENLETWINLVAFQAYMELHHGSLGEYRDTPFSSRAPSRSASASLLGSRASSRTSLVPSSWASSPFSLAVSDSPSCPSSAMSFDDVIVINDSDDPDDGGDPPARVNLPKVECPPSPTLSMPEEIIPHAPEHKRRKGKGKAKANSQQIQITRQLDVNQIVEVSSVPSTWNVPRTPTAFLVDASDSQDLLTTQTGKSLSIDAYIRSEDQESWGGSTGHIKGDVDVFGLTPDLGQKLRCRRCHFKCNGVETCEFIDPALFANCERYEPDDEAMRELWNHELDANEREAASAPGIISRFYARIMNSKCKIQCDGVPTLILRSHGPSSHGKRFFVGCSKWSRAHEFEHLYWPIAPNINEDDLRVAMQNNGLLPTGPTTLNETCVLTVHPRVGLKNCPYSHIIDGHIKPAKIIRRSCNTEMLIFIPVDPAYSHKALVILRNPHNHPAHPKTKPNVSDRTKLVAAVQAAGLTESPSTSTLYGGRLTESSPAFTDSRRLRDFIGQEKKKEHPQGMGWEVKLPKEDRYIHTAMTKNGFRLVVTMHPQIAVFIHLILSLNIDYTFKRVDGDMDEWEVAGFLDRFKHRLTFASLYCDAKKKEAFAQLFEELFDTIHQVTGEKFKLAPFFPDAKCRVIIMDGEVPQAQGLAMFLGKYNDPKISGLWTLDTVKLLKGSLKTCNPHFERHIDELPIEIPKSVIMHLKSILGLSSQKDIDEWHEFCAAQTHEAIANWYAHKLANPWVLPSVNKFLSNIKDEDWDITPVHSNYVETAHAGRNAETAVGVGLLTAILQAQERDNIRAAEIAQIECDGVMRNRWNGSSEREKLSAQRKVWNMRKGAIRSNQLTSFDSLKAERETGTQDNKASLERQKILDSQIKSLQNEMRIDKHRTDLGVQVNELRKDVEEEKSLRREWAIRRAAIDLELDQLRKGPLAGARIAGRRPTGRPSGEDEFAATTSSALDTTTSGVPNFDDSNISPGHDVPLFRANEELRQFKQPALETTFQDSVLNSDSIPPELRDHINMPMDYNENLNETDITALNNFFFGDQVAPAENSADYPALQNFNMEDYLPDFDLSSFNFSGHGESDAELFPTLPMPPIPSPPRPATSEQIPSIAPSIGRKRGRQEVDEANIIQGSRVKTETTVSLGGLKVGRHRIEGRRGVAERMSQACDELTINEWG
ncbi:hypothetical protein B0H10DRAFT_1946692 [Mycena sp. CBHHK59/15]|nr:hypothetical protein B0H10DRAFT_1946692 [Mycena sp. CBHHK59/15]